MPNWVWRRRRQFSGTYGALHTDSQSRTYPSSATLPHLPFTIYLIQLDCVDLSHGVCKSNTSHLPLSYPIRSPPIEYELHTRVAYERSECPPMSTLKSAIERVKQREKGQSKAEWNTRKIKNSRRMTTNSRKETDHPCSEHYSLSNRKRNCQSQQRDSVREEAENATVGALDVIQGRRMRISFESQKWDSDGSTLQLFLIRMEALKHQPTIQTNHIRLDHKYAKPEACFRILPVLDNWANKRHCSGAQVIRWFPFCFLLSYNHFGWNGQRRWYSSSLLAEPCPLVSTRLPVSTDLRSIAFYRPVEAMTVTCLLPSTE